MKQTVLTDIELDVQEMKYLMESFSEEPTRTLAELLKRNILCMQGRLNDLLQEVESACETEETSVTEEECEAPTEEECEAPAEEECEVPAEEEVLVEEPELTENVVVRSIVLGESIKLSAGGLRHSISLNDSFRFSRELFDGDTGLMNRVIEQISVMSSYNTALAFLASKVDIDEENEAVNDFLELLKKYFNQPA